MLAKYEYENFIVDADKLKIEESVKVESKTSVYSDSVKRVLKVVGQSVLMNTECKAGEITYSGRVIFTAIYETHEGKIKKAESGVEFSGVIKNENILDATKYNIDLRMQKATYDLYGEMLILKGVVGAELVITSQKEYSLLKGGENLVLNQTESLCLNEYSQKKQTAKIEEDFEINYLIKEVLLHQSKANIISVNAGVQTIIVDGEIDLTLLLLQKIENSDILKEEKVIPFRVEIDCVEATPELLAEAKVLIKSVKLDVVVDEERGKSQVFGVIDLFLEGNVFELKNKVFIEDAFSLTNQTQVDLEEIKYDIYCGQETKKEAFTLKGAFNTEILAGARHMSSVIENIEVVKCDIDGGSLIIETVATLIGYFKNLDGSTEVREYNLLITTKHNVNSEYEYAIVKGCLKDLSVKIVSLNEAEVSGSVCYYIRYYKKQVAKSVIKIEEGEKKETPKSAISIYIPEVGETLWSASKRLNSVPEELIENNKELTFPLTGKERIVIFRQEMK